MIEQVSETILMMLGGKAVHVPLNLILQDCGVNGIAAGVFQAKHPGWSEMIEGASETHVLVAADAFIRPRLIIGSNALRDSGVASLYTSGFVNPAWKRDEDRRIIYLAEGGKL